MVARLSGSQSCYWSPLLDCASFLAFSTLLVTETFSASLSASFQPSTCPINPPGFGTGHSLLGDNFSSCRFCLLLCSLMTSPSSSESFRLRRRLISPVTGSTESASVRGSTGHGIRCGAATTRKDTMSVVVKSDVVMRDRG